MSNVSLKTLRNVLSSNCSELSDCFEVVWTPDLDFGLDIPFISRFCGVMFPGVIRIEFVEEVDVLDVILTEGFGLSVGTASLGAEGCIVEGSDAVLVDSFVS